MTEFAGEETQRENISDFPAKSGKPRNDAAFTSWLKEQLDIAEKAAEPKIRESTDLWNLYANDRVTDYWQQAQNDVQKQKELFRAAVVSTTCWILSAIITDSKPRIYLNPIINPAGALELAELDSNGGLPGPIKSALEDPEIGYQRFINDLLDKKTDDWWAQGRLNTKFQLTVTKALVQDKAWVYIERDGKKITYKNLPRECVWEDPYAETREDRRYVFYHAYMHVRDIEQYYDLPKGSVQPEAKYSGPREEYKDLRDLPDDIRFRAPQCRVFLGIFKDKDQPNGRTVVFITGQEEENGVKILRDTPNPYSYWPIQDLILRQGVRETEGIPIARNLECVDYMATKCIQQGKKNIDLLGNAYFFYEEDNNDDAERLSNDIQKVPVQRVGGQQFVTPQNLTTEAQNFYALLANIANEMGSTHDVTRGQRPGRVESGRAITALQESDVRSARPYIEATHNFLIPIAVVSGEMFLESVEKGDIIRYGKGFREAMQMPVALGNLVNGVEAFVGPDTEIPMDKGSILSVLSNFAQMLPPEILVQFMPIHDSEKEQILEKVNTVKQLQQALQQTQTQLEAVTREHQQMGQAVQSIAQENQKLKMAQAGKVLDLQTKMQMQDKQHAVTMAREQSRQHGKLEDTIARGVVQKDVEQLRLEAQKEMAHRNTPGGNSGKSNRRRRR